MKIKVCGITILEQLKQLATLNIDYAGFIFHPSSPRYVVNKLSGNEAKSIHNIQKVGVFVNASIQEVMGSVEEYGLSLVQLHGNETPEYCATIQKNIAVIKVFRVSGQENMQSILDAYTHCANYFLFDTLATEYGGTGKKFDWRFFQYHHIKIPYFLSGGIGLEDIDELKNIDKKPPFFALDVNSKFEISPGVKNMDAVKLLAAKVRNH